MEGAVQAGERAAREVQTLLCFQHLHQKAGKDQAQLGGSDLVQRLLELTGRDPRKQHIFFLFFFIYDQSIFIFLNLLN